MNPDIAFLQEVIQKIEAGEAHTVIVIGTVAHNGQSFIAGPGLDRQLDVLSGYLHLTPEALDMMEQGPIQFKPRSH